MSSTSGTVRALAEQLAHDDDLRARLITSPEAVLSEWGVSPAGDVVPGTVTLPTTAELAGLATASEEPEVHEPDTPVHEPDTPVHEPDPPEVHEAEEPPEVHEAEEPPEVHEAEEPEIHGPDTPEEDD